MRENFFTDQNEGYASFPQQKQFTKTWNKVLAFEKSTGKTLDEGYTKDEYVELFNSMLVKKSSTFFNDKKAVLYYVRYMIAHGELQKEQEEILSSVMAEDLSISSKSARITYFKDLDHLRAAIEDTVFAANRIDDSVFDVPSAVLYLAWFGLTEEQILTLLVKANADAEVLRIAAEAEAEANRVIAASLTSELIEKIKYEQWDGKMPTVSGSGSIVTIPGVN